MDIKFSPVIHIWSKYALQLLLIRSMVMAWSVVWLAQFNGKLPAHCCSQSWAVCCLECPGIDWPEIATLLGTSWIWSIKKGFQPNELKEIFKNPQCYFPFLALILPKDTSYFHNYYSYLCTLLLSSLVSALYFLLLIFSPCVFIILIFFLCAAQLWCQLIWPVNSSNFIMRYLPIFGSF